MRAARAARRVRAPTSAVDSSDPAWPDAVLAATGGKGRRSNHRSDLASVANANMKAAKVLDASSMSKARRRYRNFDFDLTDAEAHRPIIGVTFRTPLARRGARDQRKMRARSLALVEAGKAPAAGSTDLPLDEAPAAQAHLRAQRPFGKIVLRV